MELAFISPCSVLCGRHLHFPKVSLLPILQANPELESRGKPVYKVWGGLPNLERAELKIFDNEKPYFKVATLNTAGHGTRRLRCVLHYWAQGRGTIPELLLHHFVQVTHPERVMGKFLWPPPGTTLEWHWVLCIPASGCWSCLTASPCYICGKTPVAPIKDPPALGFSGVLSGVGGSCKQLQGGLLPFWREPPAPEDTNKTGFREHSSNSY